MARLAFDDNEQERKPVYICPDCSSDNVEQRNGEVYCLKCGLVFDHTID